MSSFTKQIIINKLVLPKELINSIKEYLFYNIKKISKNDNRYDILSTIPYKQYDPTDKSTYVYMRITDDKDYYLVYKHFKIFIQTLRYGADGADDSNVIYLVDGSVFLIK